LQAQLGCLCLCDGSPRIVALEATACKPVRECRVCGLFGWAKRMLHPVPFVSATIRCHARVSPQRTARYDPRSVVLIGHHTWTIHSGQSYHAHIPPAGGCQSPKKAVILGGRPQGAPCVAQRARTAPRRDDPIRPRTNSILHSWQSPWKGKSQRGWPALAHRPVCSKATT
jgi:hypothetical protein